MGEPVLAHSPAFRGLVLVAAATCLFWSASNYAEVLGDRLATDFGNHLADQAAIVVYSTDPLRLDAPGARTEVLDKAGAPFRYRYSGLRLLDHRGGNYLLVTDRWTLGGGVVLFLPDSARIRVDFVRA